MEATPMDNVLGAITNLATTVQTNALSVVSTVLPVMATVIAAVLVARLGVKLVKNFSK